MSQKKEGYIFEVYFGYNTNLGRYTTLMSDMHKLSEIAVNRGLEAKINST